MGMKTIKKCIAPLLLVVMTVLAVIGTIACTGKASSYKVPYLTKKVIGRYNSYKHVENGNNDYYIVGGHKYDSDAVRVTTQVSDNSNQQVNVVVKEPAMKPNLSAHQKKQMKDVLVDWNRGNKYLTDPSSLSLLNNSTPDYDKWSLRHLFKNYQKNSISVEINKN